MIVAIVAEENATNIIETINSISYPVDAIELRLDYLSQIDFDCLKKIKDNITLPVIFTLRSKEHGGLYNKSESTRLLDISKLVEINPDYIDIETHVDKSFLKQIKQMNPLVKIIYSYHNFKDTPKDLHNILNSMKAPEVSVYKIITYANSSLDNFSALNFIKQHSNSYNIVTHCMGELGLPSRLIGNVLGNYFTYSTIDYKNSIVSGCPDLYTLFDIYRLNNVNNKTDIFALLGDPVDHSVGHIFHNKRFYELNKNALYVKINLKEVEILEFKKLLFSLPFKGFSVTTPLKQRFMNHVDFIEAESKDIDAINTLLVRNKKLFAKNTDGLGAVDAIKELISINNSNVLIIGAGGAAKAIVHEAQKNNPLSITILNRTISSAKAISQSIDAAVYDFMDFNCNKTCFDIIINTVPNSSETNDKILNSIRPFVSSKTVYMNIDYSKDYNSLTESLKNMSCILINPKNMFYNQAARQLDYWFSI